MPVQARPPLRLLPEQGTDLVEGRTIAVSCPVWLRIEPFAELIRYKWVRLRYSSSLFDDPVRPLIRFVTRHGDTIIWPMNGAVLGSAEWVGRIPDGTTAVSISPVLRTGPFAFRLDSVSPVRRTDLARQSFRQNPDWLLWAARSRLLQSRREAWQAIGFATSGTPISDYAQWHAKFARRIELDGLDRPRSNWRSGKVFRLLLRLRGRHDPIGLRATLRSLRGQIYPRWSLCGVSDATTSVALLAAFRRIAAGDVRLSHTSLCGDPLEPVAAAYDSDDFVAMIDVGDRLPDYALAVIAEALSQDGNFDLVYSDEDSATPHGGLHDPVLKPAFSPILQAQQGYIGGHVWLRPALLQGSRVRELIDDAEGTIDNLVQEIPPSRIRHIRRVLISRQATVAVAVSHQTTRASAHEPAPWPQVAAVIPTRDNAGLLAECIAGLRRKTDYPLVETIVVDNGSSDAAALRLLQEIAAMPNVTVLRRPGPFNFSALSNDGAQVTKAAILLFLNNDIEMFERNWLKAMVRWTVSPNIGVVGAKLLFPNRRIQHAGVVLGFGGIAGHVYRRLPQDYPGYLAQLTVPHEVAAVTGACMAVERAKFEAVGGFDAEHLPVDLNDIDFCLRIAERGWNNIWTPEAALIHRQSATRGIDSDPFALYRKERSYFVERWSGAIRDDPYFHPGLSLYAHKVALA